MAFVMAHDNSPSPAKSYGTFRGLLNQSTEGGTIQQLAVELDTYYNNEFDPDDNHVGINTVSIKSIATFGLNSIGVNLKDGREILNWVFTSFPIPKYTLFGGPNSNEKIKNILIIIFPIITGVLVLAICTYVVVKACRPECGKNLSEEDIENRSRTAANAPKNFILKQLSKATNNFSKENLLGTGGFGSVNRGTVADPPSTVAVKKISATLKQGEREYLAEICTIGRLRHKNLVQLQGWCHERHQLLLVYDFMPNGSLDRFICNGSLDWQTRCKILTELASALLYLHEECGSTVVHPDVKPNNVMLDSEFNAHLGDFGLARLLQNEASVTTVLAGTPGYLAPECGYTGKATPESDVFSFEIVALEVLCGRRCIGCIEEKSLVDYVWSLHGKEELMQCVDQKLQNNFNQEEMNCALVIGLACSHPVTA